MSGHESIIGKDTEVHRLFHVLMEHVDQSLRSPKTGMEPKDPDNTDILQDLFYHMGQYVYRNLMAFAEHERRHHGTDVDPAYTHEFSFTAGFHVGLRISQEARELFELGDSPLEVMSDEKWQKELADEIALAEKRARQKEEWEEQIRKALNMDDKEYAKFRKGELSVLALNPNDLDKIKHLVENAPFAHDHGHGHGHLASQKHDDGDAPTGQYL